MEKSLFMLFLFTILPTIAYNQQDSVSADPDQLEINRFDNISRDETPKLKERFDTDLQVGTSFTYSPGNFYGPSYFISPGISYRVTPRFFLSSGVALQHSTLYPIYQQDESSQKMLPMTQAYIYARGSYFVSPRFVVNGTAYKSMMDAPRLTKNGRAVNYNYQGMSVGFQYKVSDSFSFGLQMNMQNGYYEPDRLFPASGYVPAPGF